MLFIFSMFKKPNRSSKSTQGQYESVSIYIQATIYFGDTHVISKKIWYHRNKNFRAKFP